jgi:predicted small lipoprotein YifL
MLNVMIIKRPVNKKSAFSFGFGRFIVMSMKYIFLFTLLGLAACGVKPSKPFPPSGQEGDPFPQTYPTPSVERN